MVLNLGLSGQPFAGPDAGGFFEDPSPELFARWFELAACLPFFRGHAEKNTCRKEPWSFGAETEAHVRCAIERRMRLLPTLYTLFREAARTGVPIVRPVFFADPTDSELRALDDAFLLGPDLLIAPVVQEGATERRVRLPRTGGWYAYPDGETRLEEREVVVPAPLGTLPMFARAGSIVVEADGGAQNTGELGRDLVVRVFPDASGRASGVLYEDAGEGHAHRAGDWRETTFEAVVEESEMRLEQREYGDFDPGPRRIVALPALPAGPDD